MITEKNFTRAMEKAVEKRGGTWRYPAYDAAPPGFYAGYGHPTYSDGQGNPTCLIGAAMDLLGMWLPKGSQSPSAVSVLMGHVEDRVVMAARCAQIHQDRLQTWGEALDIYKAALEIQQSRGYSVIEAGNLYNQAHAKVTGQEVTIPTVKITATMNDLAAAFKEVSITANKAASTMTFDGFAFGGVITSGALAGSKITVSFGDDTGAKNVTGSFASVFMPTKAEHALTA